MTHHLLIDSFQALFPHKQDNMPKISTYDCSPPIYTSLKKIQEDIDENAILAIHSDQTELCHLALVMAENESMKASLY